MTLIQTRNMDLLQVRKQFITTSGRHDLVVDTTDYADDGANFFIQAGNDFLDDRQVHPDRTASVKFTLSAGQYSVEVLPRARAVYDVWVDDGGENEDEGLSKLTSMTWGDFHEEYPLVGSDDGQDRPEKYTLDLQRQADTDIAGNKAIRRILFVPRADYAYTLVVQGSFYTELADDEDVSYWSLNHPDMLVMAALYKLEVFYRNTQGAQDWLRQIQLQLSDIDRGVAAEEVSHFNDSLYMNNSLSELD